MNFYDEKQTAAIFTPSAIFTVPVHARRGIGKVIKFARSSELIAKPMITSYTYYHRPCV